MLQQQADCCGKSSCTKASEGRKQVQLQRPSVGVSVRLLFASCPRLELDLSALQALLVTKAQLS
jgi:hypothetical protein